MPILEVPSCYNSFSEIRPLKIDPFNTLLIDWSLFMTRGEWSQMTFRPTDNILAAHLARR